ncbi:hypothetical protein PLESTB_000930900 [Pleodorina starrii]|uniref:PDZ domain-containing protein n=1 Tax=Pleodorina starrii TaxID=330485 RepID=A0A9W6BPB3_9CHLO|nr:hypothetical protein PLESTM_001554300 [Pleodorina starrii]GLC55011.1 hypothetical protein PLESTB_000930900 [Pleodorina starrii]GLC68424.1 hypothetical protein PLESTF_000690000 [Pleodorina starrii]
MVSLRQDGRLCASASALPKIACHVRSVISGLPAPTQRFSRAFLTSWPAPAAARTALPQLRPRLIAARAASDGSGDYHPSPGEPKRPTAASLLLAAGTALSLLLGSGPAPNVAGLPGPLGPPAVAVAHAESPAAAPLTATEAAGPDRAATAAPPARDVPLQRNVDPMTMQLPEAPPDLTPEEVRAIRIFARNTPSVVNITNIQQVPLGNGFWSSAMDVQKVPAGFGSGFMWDDKGHVVTNFHVIRGADEVKVTLLDQTTYSARVVGGDADKDVAVLQLLGLPPDKMVALQPVTLGSSAGLLVGQRVFAIGNPLGLEHTLTSGIVSGLNRELSTGSVTIKGLVQTDAAINPGNSGGVLLDSGGRVIGINTAIADPSGRGASSGVGFALPIDSVRGLVEQILTYGRVLRPVLGVTLAPPQILKQLGQPGVLVLEVPRGSPAEKAGLKPTTRDRFTGALVLGDIVTGIDGRPVRNYSDLVDVLDDKRVGDTVKVDILRSQTDNLFASGAARKMTVAVTLGERGQVNVTE